MNTGIIQSVTNKILQTKGYYMYCDEKDKILRPPDWVIKVRNKKIQWLTLSFCNASVKTFFVMWMNLCFFASSELERVPVLVRFSVNVEEKKRLII